MCHLICTVEHDVLRFMLTHFSLLSPLGLALTSGTTHIPATQTRMWWKTILRCSIVSGLESGLSCSKVVASACGCGCSVSWSSLYPTVSEGWAASLQRQQGKTSEEARNEPKTCLTVHTIYLKCHLLKSRMGT